MPPKLTPERRLDVWSEVHLLLTLRLETINRSLEGACNVEDGEQDCVKLADHKVLMEDALRLVAKLRRMAARKVRKDAERSAEVGAS